MLLLHHYVTHTEKLLNGVEMYIERSKNILKNLTQMFVNQTKLWEFRKLFAKRAEDFPK